MYLYATASFSALDRLLQDAQERTGGLHVAYPIARLLQRLGLIATELPNAIPAFRNLGMTSGTDVSFNAYTFLYYPLVDFGLWGALAYALLIGFGGGVAHGWLRADRASPIRLLVMAHISTALVLSTFVNKFNNTATWYVGILTVLPFLAAGAGRQLSDRDVSSWPRRIVAGARDRK